MAPADHGNAQRGHLERAFAEGRAPFPLARELGIRFLALEAGRAEISLAMGRRFHNPAGIVHGGVLFGLLDTAMGFAATSVLEGACWVSTVDAKVSFMRAVRDGTLRAEAHVVRSGKTVIHLEAWLRDEAGSLVAQALGIAIVVPETRARAYSN